jgi:hypothetical protein
MKVSFITTINTMKRYVLCSIVNAYLVAKPYIKISVWRAFNYYLNHTLNFKSLRNALVQYLTIASLMI